MGKNKQSLFEVSKLYNACHLEPGTLTDEMIRGRIVVGLMDTKLSEKLQLDPELTLPKASNQAQQSEAIKKQTLMWNGFKESTGKKNEVDVVKADKLPKLMTTFLESLQLLREICGPFSTKLPG